MTNTPFKIVNIDESNLNHYGLLCLKSKKKEEGYQNKIDWIKARFKEGLKYKLLLVEEKGKLTSRGFIEYIPGKYCWRGIKAEGYMVIHCIWIIGQYKRQGFGSKLLEECLKDAQGMSGIAVVTTNSTWLPKPKFFIKQGFIKVDSYPPLFDLYVKQFDKRTPLPKFNQGSKKENISHYEGFDIYYSWQCPYTSNMIKSIERYAEKNKIPVNKILIDDFKSAQENVHPYGTSCYLFKGEVLTYHSDNISKLVEDFRQKEMKS